MSNDYQPKHRADDSVSETPDGYEPKHRDNTFMESLRELVDALGFKR